MIKCATLKYSVVNVLFFTSILYNICKGLSRGFRKFFEIFFYFYLLSLSLYIYIIQRNAHKSLWIFELFLWIFWDCRRSTFSQDLAKPWSTTGSACLRGKSHDSREAMGQSIRKEEYDYFSYIYIIYLFLLFVKSFYINFT